MLNANAKWKGQKQKFKKLRQAQLATCTKAMLTRTHGVTRGLSALGSGELYRFTYLRGVFAMTVTVFPW
jgi:hypothetical protein